MTNTVNREYKSDVFAIYSLLKSVDGDCSDRLNLEQILLKHLDLEDQQDYKDVIAGVKYPSLMSDVVAKKIFNVEEHPERIEYLLKSVTKDDTIEIPVQVNGKTKVTIDIVPDISKDEAIAAGKAALEAAGKMSGTIVKEIYVPGKIVNIVVKP